MILLKKWKNYVRFGEAYFQGRDLRFREGSPLFLHAWVGWILHTLVRRKIYFWSQQNRSFASCILMICYMSLPTAKVSNECRTPRVFPLAVAELQMCCEKPIEIIEMSCVVYLPIYEYPIKINQTHGSVNTLFVPSHGSVMSITSAWMDAAPFAGWRPSTKCCRVFEGLQSGVRTPKGSH